MARRNRISFYPRVTQPSLKVLAENVEYAIIDTGHVITEYMNVYSRRFDRDLADLRILRQAMKELRDRCETMSDRVAFAESTLNELSREAREVFNRNLSFQMESN